MLRYGENRDDKPIALDHNTRAVEVHRRNLRMKNFDGESEIDVNP